MTQIKLRIFVNGFSNYWSSNLYFKYTIPRDNQILRCNKVYIYCHDILCKIFHMYPGISLRRWIYIPLSIYWQFQQNQCAYVVAAEDSPVRSPISYPQILCHVKNSSLTFHSFTEGNNHYMLATFYVIQHLSPWLHPSAVSSLFPIIVSDILNCSRYVLWNCLVWIPILFLLENTIERTGKLWS